MVYSEGKIYEANKGVHCITVGMVKQVCKSQNKNFLSSKYNML